MKRSSFAVLVAGLLALAIPAAASASGSPESSGGENCSSSGALIAANCTNISGPQTQVGGGLVNEQNQSNSQQNGDNSGTSNANTNAVAVGNSQPSNGYEGESESSGSGGNCSQHGAIIAANCTNYSGGQYQAGGGLVNQQNQSNNQQNGDNSGTSNANTNAVVAGHGNSPNGYEGSSESSGSGGNCSQKATLIAANCTNISKGQEQVGGGGREMYTTDSIGGGGSLANQQNQSNNQQNGDNSGTHNYNANVIAVGGHSSNDNAKSNGAESWSGNSKSESSGGGGNCSQFLTAVSANCTNYSGGQTQSNGGGIRADSLATIGGGGSLVNQQNQSNNQQNGDNSGTSNQNANVIAVGSGPRNGGNGSNDNGWEESSGSGGNCSQALTLFAINCTNYSGGQTQSNGGGGGNECDICPAFVEPGGGGSLVNQQNQSNNQQNGDNSGTSNQNANVIALGHGNSGLSNNSGGGNGESSGSGGNCSQFLTAVSANCTNISKGQQQSNGGGREVLPTPIPFAAAPGGGGSLVNQQNQSNNQQNGDNSGTSNQNANVIAVGGPSEENGNNVKDGNQRWSEDGYREESGRSGSGGNCSQALTLFAANCTNYSKGQWQSNGGRSGDNCEIGFEECREESLVSPGGGGSLVNQQNQGNNQQNGDNSGTHNYESNVIIVPGRRYTERPV